MNTKIHLGKRLRVLSLAAVMAFGAVGAAIVPATTVPIEANAATANVEPGITSLFNKGTTIWTELVGQNANGNLPNACPQSSIILRVKANKDTTLTITPSNSKIAETETVTVKKNQQKSVYIQLLRSGSTTFTIKASDGSYAKIGTVTALFYDVQGTSSKIQNFAKEVKTEYAKIPANVRTWLEAEGLFFKIKNTSKLEKITGLNKFGNDYGYAVGNGGTYVTLAGLADSGAKWCTLHEVGHVLHQYANQKLNKEITKIYNKNINNKYFREYVRETKEEFFAESFKCYFNDTANLKSKCPAMYKLIEDVIKNLVDYAAPDISNVTLYTDNGKTKLGFAKDNVNKTIRITKGSTINLIGKKYWYNTYDYSTHKTSATKKSFTYSFGKQIMKMSQNVTFSKAGHYRLRVKSMYGDINYQTYSIDVYVT